MPTKADQILVELAVRNHLISESEGAECMAEAGTSGDDVGAVLLRKQFVKDRHLQSLKRKLTKILEEHPEYSTQPAGSPAAAAPPPPPQAAAMPVAYQDAGDATFVTGAADSPLLSTHGAMVLFGQIGVHMKAVGQPDVDRALVLQEQLAAQNQPMRLGQILVRAKRLTEAQVREILEFQEKWIFKCAACFRRFNVSATQEGPSMRCGVCGGALMPGSESSISVQATHAGPEVALAPMRPSQGRAGSDRRNPATPDDPAGLVGLTWKRYHVKKVLGRGGMGAVYMAEQTSLRRGVALKVMLRGTGQAAPGERERFEREAKLIGALNHPNIVKVLEAEWDNDLCWFTMELVPGEDFKVHLRSGTFPMGKGAAVIAKVARAMDFAHRKGVVHRDLKPQNVMIDAESGEPKVLDFGLAKNVDAEQMEQLTQMGAFLGTPAYMAPEQAGGDPSAIDARADVYALGAMLYEVLTGRPPFTGKKAIHIIRKVLKEDPIPPRQVFPQADARLEAIALRALQKDPDARYATAGEMADDIEKVVGRVSRIFTRTEGADRTSGGTDSTKDSRDSKKGFFGRLFGG
jgi:predicted Ser/Thr protein kinase